jgi:hypothetical protein
MSARNTASTYTTDYLAALKQKHTQTPLFIGLFKDRQGVAVLAALNTHRALTLPRH